ncbi:MAG: tRNA glutamyl-Q(34) synthetase GluQRS [Acidimicrobiales bacterium]|nr:tRNA glutamyl-Q(34) synthetase GluQRS [Acidimicrobiales bacterium]
MVIGRFAPSPTGPLHVGNLRTALLAWLFARSAGSSFLLRIEDLEARPDNAAHEAGQRRDLQALGLDWDGPVVHQSERRARHHAMLAALEERGLTYPCFCSRREIREAAAAPHGPVPGVYPGTCRELTDEERRRQFDEGRPAALRLRSSGEVVTIDDRLRGPVTLAVDDVVLRRNDGVPAYNLAVVVDDADQGVGEVVRGDDLLSSTPRQAHLADLLGLARPTWAHVPLVVGTDGERLAKRHGAVTLADLAREGRGADAVRSEIAASLGLAAPGEPVTVGQLLDRFDPARLPTEPWVRA